MTKILLFILCMSCLQVSAKQIVVIDPGHGGDERGAVNGKYEEADLALQVSKKVNALLLKEKNIRPYLTRTVDKTMSLHERVVFAQNLKADLFVSIHINASTNKRAQGGEVYIKNQLTPAKEKAYLAQFENGKSKHPPKKVKDSMFFRRTKNTELVGILESVNDTFNLKLASLVAKDILTAWGGKKRLYHERIHQAPFYVVKYNKMPAILVELGFISNTFEAKKLSTKSYQMKLAKGIVKGIVNYFERIEAQPETPLYSRVLEQ